MMKLNTNLALLAMAGAVVLTSCSNDDDLYQGDQTLKEYEENFKSTFGEVDPNQDWNMATRSSVTVSVPTTTSVEIYAKIGDEMKCVGNYSKVSGTQTLNFDILKGVSEVYVYTPSTAKKVALGGTADFSGSLTRSSHPGTSYGITVANAAASLDKELSASDVFVYQTVLPEKKDNRGKVTQNFNVTSNGKTIVIYPIYWQTSQTNTVGIYYKNDDNTITQVPVYTIKDTDDSKAKLFIQSTTESWPEYSKGNYPDWLKVATDNITDYNNPTETNKADVKAAFQKKLGSDVTIEQVWIHSNGNVGAQVLTPSWIAAKDNIEWNGEKAIGDKYTGKVLSKGIEVTVPANKLYGFYLTTGSQTFYSEAELNPDDYYDANDVKLDKKACHAAIYKKDEVTYLAFEDWFDDKGSDMDLNDVVLRVDGIDPEKSEEVHNKDVQNVDNSISWIIACEDLGSTDDYDFNDVVVEVQYLSSSNQVKITPLAAGGTLKSEIYFNNQPQGEIHNLINSEYGQPKDNGSYTMLNTDGGANPGSGNSIYVNVGGDFSLASSNDASNFGGFSIKVYQNDGTEEARTITAPKRNGEAPQMFLVSSDWKWPKERKDIEEAYPSFSTWVQNAESLDWQSNKNNDLIYQR